MKSEKGFTLLEVMISLLILATGLLGVTALTTTSVKVNSNANHLTWAYQTAQADLEKLRSLPWGSISNGTRTATCNGVAFTSTWAFATTGNIKNVSVSVAWNDSRDHQIDVVTRIAR
jgi:type IV pilus modification protein PilV